jgi:hypothetical protein
MSVVEHLTQQHGQKIGCGTGFGTRFRQLGVHQVGGQTAEIKVTVNRFWHACFQVVQNFSM